MSVSMNLVSSIPTEIKSMNFLGLQINNIFTKSTEKTVHITDLAKELLGSKRETSQETEAALLASKYSSLVGEKSLKLFVMSLHKLPSNPLEVGLEYIKKAPGYDPIKGFQVPNDWGKNETVTLHQIYKEQFFVWILKNSQLPFDSILHMLHLFKGFDDLSIELGNKIWNKRFLTEKKQKQKEFQSKLKEFQSKYEFLLNNKFLQSFPVELEKITVTCDIQKSIDQQNEIIIKILKWLFNQLIEKVQAASTFQNLTNSFEDLPERNFSKKWLSYRLKKILPFLQEKFFPLIESSKSQMVEEKQAQLKELEEGQVEIKKILEICKEKREQISSQKSQPAKNRRKASSHEGEFNIQDVMKDVMEQYNELKRQEVDPIERDAQVNQRLHRTLKEKMTTLEHVRSTEDFFENQNQHFESRKKIVQDELVVYKFSLKEDFSYIRFLISYMNTDIAKEQARSKEKKLNLFINRFDEILKEEFIDERKSSSSKTSKYSQKPLDVSDQEEPASSEKEESVVLFEQPVHSSTPVSRPYTIEQIRSYLSDNAKNKQINGALSQSAESILQQIQPYLHQKQGKEVYDHALLGAAALEQMAQAIHEGRIDHVVLGFRNSLIHCHFAIEQLLSQKIFQKTGKKSDTHNLTTLANTLEANTQKFFSDEDRIFLEEIRVHLWFHYPEDYRLYFAHNNVIPQAFFLLETLLQPGITQEHVQEAMNFSFEKYYQTLEFITKLSGAPTQNAVELFKSGLRDLQKHLKAIKEPKKLSVKSSLIPKLDRILKELTSLDRFIHVKDLSDGWILANFSTVKFYLRLMKVALELPQEATKHSLQKFIQVETLLNVEKLFKNLFRVISFLQFEKDTHMHDLNKFFLIIKEFYKSLLSKRDRELLSTINLGITHHYLHTESSAGLKKNYERFLSQARVLSSVDQEFSTIMRGNTTVSYETLESEERKIIDVIESSLGLFIRLLHPVIEEIETINENIARELKKLDDLEAFIDRSIA